MYWPTVNQSPSAFQATIDQLSVDHHINHYIDCYIDLILPLVHLSVVLWLEQNSHNHSNNEREGDVCWKLLSLLVAHKNIMVYYNLMLKCFNQK